MDRAGITAANLRSYETLRSITLKDPFFQRQKETFDHDGVEGLILNCAGTGSQFIRPLATCAIDQNTQPYKLHFQDLVSDQGLIGEADQAFDFFNKYSTRKVADSWLEMLNSKKGK